MPWGGRAVRLSMPPRAAPEPSADVVNRSDVAPHFTPDVLLLDSRDSFTFNLAHLAAELGAVVDVVDADDVDDVSLDAINSGTARPRLVLVGPGPRGPAELPHLVDLLRGVDVGVPVFGVCLGLQAMVVASGGEVDRAQAPIHGKRSAIRHRHEAFFADLPTPLWVMRYHSLVASRLPADTWDVLAVDDADQVMAIHHRERPWQAVQFHPESIGTAGGRTLLANILRGAGIDVDDARCADRPGATPPSTDVGPGVGLTSDLSTTHPSSTTTLSPVV